MPAPKKPADRILSWEDIEAAEDLPTENVPCPEWGGSVRIRALSRKVSVDTLAECTDPETGIRDGTKLQLLLVVRGVVEPVISEDRLEQLNRKHPDPIARVCRRVEVLSGMAPDSAQEAAAGFPG